MSRSAIFLFSLALYLACQAHAQQAPAIDKTVRETAAAIEAPKLPPPAIPAPPTVGSTPASPVAPPMPGQLTAPPAAPPSRIPDLPPETNVVPSTALQKTKPTTSTSSSGQFIVHGNDLSLRSAFSSRCEEISDELRQLLRDQQSWALPIVVLLSSGDAAKKADKAANMIVSLIPQSGFHLQVNVNLRPDLRPTDMRAEIIRALLAERILRNQKELASKRELLLPDWLYTGILQALDYRKQARPSTLFAAIFKSGKIYGIEEIIEASPVQMDALSKTIYQTSCCALVLALLDQPEGGSRLNRFLASLASDPRPERDLLNQAFPSFATSPASLNKWWSLQLASLSRPSASEPLSAVDTLKALEDAITLRYQAKASEVPKPRPVMAAIPPTPVVADVKPRPKAESETETPEATTTEPEASTPEEKRSFFSRLNPFSRKKASSDEVIAAAIEEAAIEEAKSTPPEEAPKVAELTSTTEEIPAARPEERKPLFNRWFGKTKPEADVPEEKSSPEDSPKPTKKDESPVEVPEEQADKKGSLLNPLNWFRRSKDKEPKEEPPAEKTEEKTDANKPKSDAASVNLSDWQSLASPMVALVYQVAAVEEPVKEKKRFLGLFGGKKKEEEKPSPETTPEEKPTKPESKPEEKPKTPAKEEPKAEKAEKSESKPEEKAAPKPEAKEMAPEKESPPKAEPEPDLAMPAEPTLEKPKAKREPLRLRSLFGSGKKKTQEAEEKVESPAPAPQEPTATPAAESATMSKEDKPAQPEAPSKPQSEKKAATEEKPRPVSEAAPAPKPESPKEDAPKKAKEPEPKAVTPKKAPPPKDEPLVAASVPLEDYAAILKRKDRKEILQQNFIALTALQQRCAILYRPIVADYTALVVELMDGKTKNVDERLKKLRARSQQALEQSKAVRSLLDLHEANSTPAMSGMFEDYLKLPETIQKELPERKDPISKYLDALDREFSK